MTRAVRTVLFSTGTAPSICPPSSTRFFLPVFLSVSNSGATVKDFWLGAHVEDGDVGMVLGQPLAVDHRAGHVQRQRPLGQTQQGGACKETGLNFHGLSPWLMKRKGLAGGIQGILGPANGNGTPDRQAAVGEGLRVRQAVLCAITLQGDITLLQHLA